MCLLIQSTEGGISLVPLSYANDSDADMICPWGRANARLGAKRQSGEGGFPLPR